MVGSSLTSAWSFAGVTSSGGANTTAVAETVAFELTGVPNIVGSAEVAGAGTAVAPGGNLATTCFAFGCVLRTGAKASAADHPERLRGKGVGQMQQRK